MVSNASTFCNTHARPWLDVGKHYAMSQNFCCFFFLLLKDVYAAKAINSETNIGVDRQRNAHLAHPISDIDIHN